MSDPFSAAGHLRDSALNHYHRNALRTVTWFLGRGPWDYAEFLYGRLISGWTCPF